MHGTRLTRTALAIIPLITIGLASCTSPETQAAPRLPKNFCWGAFDKAAVQKILPSGNSIEVEKTGPFDLYSGRESITCSVYVDGNTSFQATANRTPFKASVEDHIRAKDRPDSISVPSEDGAAYEGWAWSKGGASHFTCEQSERSSDQEPYEVDGGAYILLGVSAKRLPKEAAGRKFMTSILREYTQFAVQALNCKRP